MSGPLFFRCDGAADGDWNMAADESLAEGLDEGRVHMRFYSWRQPTVSLGAFQRHAALEAARLPRGLPVVRRPSGGGAILHGSDLTYAVAVSRWHPWGSAAQRLYDAVHAAAVEALRAMGLAATLVPSETMTGSGFAPRTAGQEPDGPFLCFDRRSPSDVVIDGHKVLGSGQRRLRSAVVQHGSLLLRRCEIPAGTPSPGAVHPGLENLSGRSVDPSAIITGWIDRLAASLGGSAVATTPPLSCPRAEGVAAAAARYRSEEWTRRR